jgi:nucleotide-binding universal stress UspA family protein
MRDRSWPPTGVEGFSPGRRTPIHIRVTSAAGAGGPKGNVMTIKRILHASDFSPASRSALKVARDLARALKAQLILCHAYEALPPLGGEASIPSSLFSQIMTSAREGATRQLEKLAKATRGGGVRVATVLVEGPPAMAVIRVAKRKGAHLIVVGTHGRTGVQRMLMGSVAERIVRLSPCPVLTVRPGRG